MKLKFLAGVTPVDYVISGSVINGIDASLFIEGASFVGNEETKAAGIFDMFWREGELCVVLSQATKTTNLPWAPRGKQWVSAADYDPNACYVKATNPQAVSLLESGKAEYKRLDNGTWTVALVEQKEGPAA